MWTWKLRRSPCAARNMWKLNLDGTLVEWCVQPFDFTNEPTGLAFDSATGRMYISDDDKFKIYVDHGQSHRQAGAIRAQAPWLQRSRGRRGQSEQRPPVHRQRRPTSLSRSSRSTTPARRSSRPSFCPRKSRIPRRRATTPAHDVFFVGSEFSPDIWMVDRNGNILNDIDIFVNYRNPSTTARQSQGIDPRAEQRPQRRSVGAEPLRRRLREFACQRRPHARDFRPILWNHQAPAISTNNLTTVQNPDGSMTVLGVQVTDSDALASSQTFSFTATTGAAASGASITPPTSSGSLTGINSVLAMGVTYHPGVTPPSTDMMTLTVKDNFGQPTLKTLSSLRLSRGPTSRCKALPART